MLFQGQKCNFLYQKLCFITIVETKVILGLKITILKKAKQSKKYQLQKVVRMKVGGRKLFQSCLQGKIDTIHNFEKIIIL